MSFTFKPDEGYFMPVCFGPAPELFKVLSWNGMTAIDINYLTDKDALAALLPKPFEPANEPIVTIYYAMNKEVECLAWRGYNFLGVALSAVFNGKKDHVPGALSIVEWANDAYGAFIGRDLAGINKLYADISDVKVEGNSRRFHNSEYGTRLIECEARNLREVSDKEREQIKEMRQGGFIMGWKYIPRGDGKGAELSVPTTVPETHFIDRAWIGEGSHRFFETTWEQTPAAFRVMKGLQTLVVKEYRETVVIEGSLDALIPEIRTLE